MLAFLAGVLRSGKDSALTKRRTVCRLILTRREISRRLKPCCWSARMARSASIPIAPFYLAKDDTKSDPH